MKRFCVVDDRFVTLASLVAAPSNLVNNVPVSAVAPHPSTAARCVVAALDIARADIAQELALLRLAALEAFERASADLLARLARDVLARELAIAPADLAALAARALAAFAEHEPIALVVAPIDAVAFETSLPVRADRTLDAGDLVVEVRDGAFESRFMLRVNETIAATAVEATS